MQPRAFAAPDAGREMAKSPSGNREGAQPGAVESSCCGGSRPRWWLQPRTAVLSHAAPRSDAPALPEQRLGREIRKRFLLLIKEFATVKGRQKHS